MFPSAGYFRSTNCPFFVHGLCHRPYCHFRHSKPGLKASKSKTSPHKGTNEEKTHTLTPTKTGVVPKLYSATTVVESKTETAALPKDATQDSDKSKVSTSAQLRGILKRSTSEEEDTKQQSSHTELPSVQDLNHSETKVTPQVTDNRNEDTLTLELDDSEPPFPSLTEEEKQIIGLPTHPENVNQSQTSCSEKNGDFQKVHVLNHDSMQTVYKDLSSENKIVKQGGDVGSHHGNHRVSKVVQEGQAKEINETNSNETLPSQKGREEVIVDSAMDHTASPDGVNKDTKVAEEKSDRSSAMKRKSIKLEISSDGGSQNIPNDFLFNVPKKRKSQKLSCKNESFSQMKDLSVKEKGYGEAVVNPQTTKQKPQYNSALFEKVCDSGKLLFDTKDKSKNKTISTLNEVMSDFGDAKTMKGKTVAKNSTLAKLDVPKKKAKVSEAGINFFSSSKKLGKQSKVDRKNMSSDFNISPSKTSKPRQSPPVKEIQQLKRVATKNIHVDTIRIDSTSDSSDVCSPVFSDSSPEEEEQLKRIWNDFEPDHITIEDEVVQSPVKKQPPVKSPSKNVTSNSVHVFEKADTGKQASLANTLGLGKKQRVAHATNHLPRRLSSNANPVRRYPKTLAAVHRQSVSAPGPSVESSSEASSNYASRKRVAHVPKSTSPAGSLPRPKIPVEYGAKVPQNQRQRYLDRIVDEYLRLCSNEKFAFEKAVEEEQVLYERSTRRQVYLNLCVNAIKKLRGLTHIEAPVESESTRRVAKTLTSGAVVISTVSPVKQQRVPSVSDQLTEEVLYDFLVKYLLNEEDLVENGYPRQCPTAPGKAVYKSRKEQPSKNSRWRTCRRCGKPFAVLEDGEYQTKEECIYHAGKLFRRKGEPITNYSCCQGDAGSTGCCVGKVHVCDAVCDPDGFMTTIVSPLRDNNNKVYAIDCEMCYTTAGLELTRITVVNWNLEQVYDSFVLPERRIVDYNTRFSGVTEESLRGVTTTIREIQAVLLSMIHKDTILVGHSLESDLKATKLIHSKVVDTSVVFPHRLGPPYKRALRNLMAEHLKKIIQDSVNGHDSHEDAAACLELMRWKVKEDIRKLTRPKGPLRSTHT